MREREDKRETKRGRALFFLERNFTSIIVKRTMVLLFAPTTRMPKNLELFVFHT